MSTKGILGKRPATSSPASPSVVVKVVENMEDLNPHAELLDAPTFFELYRIYLRNQP